MLGTVFPMQCSEPCSKEDIGNTVPSTALGTLFRALHWEHRSENWEQCSKEGIGNSVPRKWKERPTFYKYAPRGLGGAASTPPVAIIGGGTGDFPPPQATGQHNSVSHSDSDQMS